MIVEKTCAFCQGSGIIEVETSSLLGLLKRKEVSNCTNCHGKGKVYEMTLCKVCEGQGLVGNENEICRACNGTGKVDTFAFIPRELLNTGRTFDRRCDQCSGSRFEITSDIETVKLTKSWEREEELRQVEYVERVQVRCTSCGHSYSIPIDDEFHKPLAPELVPLVELMGITLDFMYQKD